MKLLILSLACLPIVLLAGTAEAGTLDPGSNVSAWAATTEFLLPAAKLLRRLIPTHTTVNATDGAVYSKNNIDWYLSGDQTIRFLSNG